MKISTYITLLVCLLTACSGSQSLEQGTYVQHVKNPENGLVKTKKLSDFDFELTYRPHEYIALTEAVNGLTNETLASKKEELDDLHYLALKIKGNGTGGLLETNATSENDYNLRLYYYSSEAQLDMHLIQEKDTMPCVLYHFERNYQLAPYNTIVMGFEPQQYDLSKSLEFVYNDRVLGLGPVRMAIDGNDLNQIPQLKL